ncbi:hypothetical protein B0J14DRAFT_605125 [Halenospora varia]|nr:hypothetical protein B0J14DRAFT_605125 [Halenospora varia]
MILEKRMLNSFLSLFYTCFQKIAPNSAAPTPAYQRKALQPPTKKEISAPFVASPLYLKKKLACCDFLCACRGRNRMSCEVFEDLGADNPPGVTGDGVALVGAVWCSRPWLWSTSAGAIRRSEDDGGALVLKVVGDNALESLLLAEPLCEDRGLALCRRNAALVEGGTVRVEADLADLLLSFDELWCWGSNDAGHQDRDGGDDGGE